MSETYPDAELKAEKPLGRTVSTQEHDDVESGDSVTNTYIDAAAEKSYGKYHHHHHDPCLPFTNPPTYSPTTVRKLDCYLLPYLTLMYFFNSVDRSNLGNAKTDGLDKDLHFVGNDYSLLILLFYIPFGTLDLPLNLLTKRFSARWVLPSLMTFWGSIALLQCATKNFGGLLALRLLMG